MGEASPPSAFSSASSSPLSNGNNSTTSSRTSTRFSHARVRKESKYIENSRQDKLFSRVWLPGHDFVTPKVVRFS